MSANPTIKPVPGFTSTVRVGGVAVPVAAPGGQGGFIWNPKTQHGQGVRPEQLFVDLTGSAALETTGTTMAVEPGQMFRIPPGNTTYVSVNAESSGHKFTVVLYTAWVPVEPAKPQNGSFPPRGVTGRTGTIPAYLYQEYTDDEDLQAFFEAYNQWQQDIVDTFNGLNLPIYTQPKIQGALLDWVGEGIYGYPRPVLNPMIGGRIIGPFNTWVYNTWPFNKEVRTFYSAGTVSSDDIYKRCLTWHFLKGDGKYFNIRWLKRRVWRWLTGVNGNNPNIDQTYRVSVTMGSNRVVVIRIVMGQRLITGGALFNKMAYNSFNPFNSLTSKYVRYPDIYPAADLRDAIASGVLELPFQFKYSVVIN